MSRRLLILCFVFCSCKPGVAQLSSLKPAIEAIVRSKQADVGLSVYHIESGDSLQIKGARHYPLQSVFKFHVALAVLDQVDKGRFTLNQQILIKRSELPAGTYSPIRDEYPTGDIRLSLADIIRYTVSHSDNNGCDILIRLLGGAKRVNDYIHSKGVKDLAIVATEADMHTAWNVQYGNWTTPAAATKLLTLFYRQKLLLKHSYKFLWETMTATTTGAKRIKGGLPEGTPVAHKTGTSDTNKEGVTAATNDIGIITLPNGQHYAISVFVAESKENGDANEQIIADISKVVWEYLAGK